MKDHCAEDGNPSGYTTVFQLVYIVLGLNVDILSNTYV